MEVVHQQPSTIILNQDITTQAIPFIISQNDTTPPRHSLCKLALISNKTIYNVFEHMLKTIYFAFEPMKFNSTSLENTFL